jgi:hypothetical protein
VTASAADRGDDRHFRPTSGTAVGWVGVALAAVTLVSVAIGERTVGDVRFAFGTAIFGLLVWCFLLRPRLVIRSASLELRNPFSAWHVPLADVRRVAVRAVTSVYTEGRRFDGVAIGRPLRSMRRGPQSGTTTIGVPGLGGRLVEAPHAAPPRPGQLDADAVADLVVEQILRASDDARSVPADGSTPQRSWAWVELVALTTLSAGLVVTLLL